MIREVSILLWTICNEKCYYCFQLNYEKKWANYNDIIEALKKWINSWFDSVSFAGWEITLYPNIIDILNFAKSLGYKKIKITTNWFKFQDISFCEKILENVTDIEISLHSIKPDVWDRITRLPGSVNGTIKWIINILKLFWNSKNITIMTILLKENISNISSLINFCIKLSINKIELIYPIWGAHSYDIYKISNIVNKLFELFSRKINIGTSYIQPCFLDKDEAQNKVLLYDKNIKNNIITNHYEGIILWEKYILDNLHPDKDKCWNCEFYNKTCYWFWK